ncbi:MAG: cation diffusion facilitator family transporter [Bdellovibrionales bacterium]
MTVQDQHNNLGHERLRRMATYASVAVAVVLIGTKLIAYLFTDSVAMLSSLLDSTIDLVSSGVTVLGVASALRPPDHDHRYGHGKAEPLAALTQAAFIIGSSILLGYEALNRIYHPHEVTNENFGYGVMALAIVLTIALVAFQNYVIKHTSSMAIGADRMHYVGDVAINLAVVVSLVLQNLTGIQWLDPLFAVLIALGLSINAWRIARHALNVLMDRELPDVEREKIMQIVRAQPNVRGMHDLRTRTDSDRVFIEFHLELDGNMTLKTAHHVNDTVIKALKTAFPSADVIVHQDPAGLAEIRLDEQIEVRAAQK